MEGDALCGFLLQDKLQALIAHLDDSDGARLYAGGDGGDAIMACGTASLLAIHRIDLNLRMVIQALNSQDAVACFHQDSPGSNFCNAIYIALSPRLLVYPTKSGCGRF